MPAIPLRFILLCTMLPAAVDAQTVRRTTSPTRAPAVVRIEGARPAVRTEEAGLQMSRARQVQAVPAATLELFEGLTATSTFVLTPNAMYVPERGMLSFELGSVRAGPNGGYTLTADNSSTFSDAYVSIYGAPGKTYLLDIVAGAGGSCVATPCDPFTLTVTQVGGGARHTIDIPGGNNPHALFAFTASTAGWYQFGLDYEWAWLFRSVTVSVLE